MKMHFDLDLSLCSACGACAVACMDQNDIDFSAFETPFRNIFRSEEKLPEGGDGRSVSFYSVACMHCDSAPCVKACPAGCISKDEETGFTVYDNANCIGCHSCSMACPFGAPNFNKDGKMQKCSGCIGRIHAGLAPACVNACPMDALRLVTDEEDAPAPGASLMEIRDKILENYF